MTMAGWGDTSFVELANAAVNRANSRQDDARRDICELCDVILSMQTRLDFAHTIIASAIDKGYLQAGKPKGT